MNLLSGLRFRVWYWWRRIRGKPAINIDQLTAGLKSVYTAEKYGEIVHGLGSRPLLDINPGPRHHPWIDATLTITDVDRKSGTVTVDQ